MTENQQKEWNQVTSDLDELKRKRFPENHPDYVRLAKRIRQLKDPLCSALMTNDPIQRQTLRITSRAWRAQYKQHCRI